MRLIALPGLTLALLLCGCGNTWWNPPFTGGYSPNTPNNTSDNMSRVMGRDPEVAPLTPEPGDIWPGPLPPSPTIGDMEMHTGIGAPTEQPNYAMPATPRPLPKPEMPARAEAPARPAPAAGSGSAITVPNGNGTSTVIHPDGRVETIPTTK